MDRQICRNDPCWCGSGRKFKKCHLGHKTTNRLPFEAISDAARQAWNQKLCLHPLAAPGECDKIVSAHTVQRSGVLERIIDSTNHVETFYQARMLMSGNPEPRRIGWRDASTFTGFCARHDNDTFASLEKQPFTGTSQQSFLVGYRALCHEVYQKKGFLRGVSVSRNLADRGRPHLDQQKIQQVLALYNEGACKGLAAFEFLKKSMDEQLLSMRYCGWSRLIIRFRGELCIASTGAVSPNRDLEGRELQTLHDSDPNHQETLLYGVVTTAEGGAVVFIWPTYQNAPRRLLESVVKRSPGSLASIVVQFMFAYVENTYFSYQWWRSLSEEERHHLAGLAGIPNAYYIPFSYIPNQIVPWEIIEANIEDII